MLDLTFLGAAFNFFASALEQHYSIQSSPSHLRIRSKHLQPLLHGKLLQLLSWRAALLGTAKHHLRPQLPVGRHAPRPLHLGVDERVVVLQVDAQP